MEASRRLVEERLRLAMGRCLAELARVQGCDLHALSKDVIKAVTVFGLEVASAVDQDSTHRTSVPPASPLGTWVEAEPRPPRAR